MNAKFPAACLAATLIAAPLWAQDSSSGSSAGQDQSTTSSGSETSGGQSAEASSDSSSASSQPVNSAVSVDRLLSAEELVDATILSLGGDYNPDQWEDEAPLQPIFADLTEIGTVQEIILSTDGQMQGVTTDIGGFLGIGRKTVLLPLSEIRLARTTADGEITVVTRLDQQALEDAPEFSLGD